MSIVLIIQLLQWRVRLAWACQPHRPQDTTQTWQSALFAKNKQRSCMWRSQLPTTRFWNPQETGQCLVMDTIPKSANALENWQTRGPSHECKMQNANGRYGNDRTRRKRLLLPWRVDHCAFIRGMGPWTLNPRMPNLPSAWPIPGRLLLGPLKQLDKASCSWGSHS